MSTIAYLEHIRQYKRQGELFSVLRLSALLIVSICTLAIIVKVTDFLLQSVGCIRQILLMVHLANPSMTWN